MRTRLVGMILLCIVIPSVAVFASDTPNQTDVPHKGPSVPVSDENSVLTVFPPDPGVAASEQRVTPQDYQEAMVAVTQKFSATIAAIAEAVQRGKLSSEQGKEMSAEEYQLAQMQFELLSLWQEIDKTDSARTPEAPASPAPAHDSEIVMVALPFSSFELSPSLADYLSLTPSQIDAIRRVMARERQSLQPLMAQLRVTREKLVVIGSGHMKDKEVKDLADAQAALVAKLIVANARMQSKIYRVLSPDQRKKLSDLERTQGSAVVAGQ